MLTALPSPSSTLAGAPQLDLAEPEAVARAASPRTVMWTLGEIADRDGVSKAAVSKKVAQLVERHSLQVERDQLGRVARVNVADYDRLRGKTDDPSKVQAPGRVAAPPSPAEPNETYDEALRQKTWHEAERRRLEVEEIKGNLLRREAVREALGRCGDELAQIFDRLEAAADDLAAAVARDGTHGLRVALKEFARRQRADAAQALADIVAARAGEGAAG
jgi:hypothetical protein